MTTSFCSHRRTKWSVSPGKARMEEEVHLGRMVKDSARCYEKQPSGKEEEDAGKM